MRTFVLFFALLAACQVAGPADEPVWQEFRDDLSPYGAWLEKPPYGMVWSPDPAVVGDDFMPYVTGGTWTLSSHGWLWVSEWTWGWAPFHYGRWLADDESGWLWVPGRHWSPAWVAWRAAQGQIGWAALPPTSAPRRAWWVFVRARELTSPRLASELIYRERARRLFYHSPQLLGVEGHDGQRWYRGPGKAAFHPDTLPEPLKIKPPHRNEILRAHIERPDPPGPGGAPRGGPAYLHPAAFLERLLPIE